MKHSRILAVLAGVLLVVMMLSPAVAETATDIALHPFVDKNDGTTLMLPDGWTEEISEEQGIYAVTTYTEYAGKSRRVIFLYASIDDWETTGKQVASSRTSFDEYMNRKEIISQSFGGAPIEEVQFNGITYFRYQSSDSLWQYFRYHNGYVHMFQFDVDVDDPYYPYFEAIMNTVVLPEI